MTAARTLTDSDMIVTLTRGELREIVTAAVREALEAKADDWIGVHTPVVHDVARDAPRGGRVTRPLESWETRGLAFGGGVKRTSAGDRVEPPRVEVTIYRRWREVPPGKKRAVLRDECVVRREVMSIDAWRELSAVLSAAGARVTDGERDG